MAIGAIVYLTDRGPQSWHLFLWPALVLMAEAAAHCGVNLWAYNFRGVSVKTAALYPIYYFYTPEKWSWDEGITLDEAQALFRHYGGFLEILIHLTSSRSLQSFELIILRFSFIQRHFMGDFSGMRQNIPIIEFQEAIQFG